MGRITWSPANHVTSPTQRDVPILWQAGHKRVETETARPPLELTSAKNLEEYHGAIASGPRSFENILGLDMLNVFC